MARSSPEAIIIVLDVGSNAAQQPSPNGKTFLSNAQLCATNIIQRKISSGSKDEIALILLGSEETNNPLADGEGYNNIEIIERLQKASWRMVATIADYKKGTTTNGDWMDALIVAADYMKIATDDDEVDSVIQGLRNEEVQVLAIGPQFYASESQGPSSQDLKSEDQQKGEKLIMRICAEVENNSLFCSFEEAIPQLAYFEQKKMKPTAWRAVMEVGSNVKIPVVGYKKIAEVKRPNMQTVISSYKSGMAAICKENSASNGTSSAQVLNQERNPLVKTDHHDDMVIDDDDDEKFGLIDKDRVYQTAGDDATPVDPADVIEGYMFGTTVVPVTDDDKMSLAYEGGPKCLSVLGFTKIQNVPAYYYQGSGCYVFFSENEENCMRAFSAFIQAMDSKDMVAIVRKIYRQGSCPSVCALIPMITPEFQCFVCYELPFAEEVKDLLFPPLVNESTKPSKEQVDVVDQLITSMDLMVGHDEEDEESEPYNPHKTLDPYEQNFYSIIAKRALNRDIQCNESEVDEAVRLLLTPKQEFIKSAEPALAKITELFSLTEIVPKEGARKTAGDLFKQHGNSQDSAVPSTSIQTSNADVVAPHIGTVHPQEDFKNLLDRGVSVEKACDLMIQVITTLVTKAFDADDLNKPLKCFTFMRKVCIDNNPSIFNDWVSKYKNDIIEEKIDFWHLITKEQASLITETESHQSSVTVEAAKQFLQIDVKNDTVPPESVEDDLDDLINQM